jgi:phage terminase large subunit-like protein
MSALAQLGTTIRSLALFQEDTFDIEAFVENLTPEQIDQILAPILAEQEALKFKRYANLFPDEGPFRRELYPRHVEFFDVGKTHRERCFMAANRVGKTVAGAYEVCAHLTGQYPDWWTGRRFRRPTDGWAAGDTNETTRDIIQKELFGEVTWRDNVKTFDGSGMIPRECIGRVRWKAGSVQDLADTVAIKHTTGRWSKLGLKSYDQGRRVFQGTAKHFIWLDEECPADVYGECLIRTATTHGIIIVTFTPLLGMSDVVMSFLPKEMRPSE